MNSLRNRLFGILVAATGVIWIAATLWIYVGTRREIEHVLDARLQEAARMTSSIIPDDVVPRDAGASRPSLAGRFLRTPYLPTSERQLSCQIWSLDGRLVARSAGAPEARLSDVPDGFSERHIEGENWRVFAASDMRKGVRVLVGDRLGLREHLVAEIIKGLLLPTVLIVPLLAFLIWASLHQGLAPLRTIARDIRCRNADDMNAVGATDVPTEIRPLVDALNGLFGKVEDARRQERDITAFAAHELRTPLAGLRMQAQIAIATPDAQTRGAALRQILASVDRTTRLVRQLLVLSRLDSGGISAPARPVNLGETIEDIVAGIVPEHAEIGVVIEPALRMTSIAGDRELLTLALRNLHENAVSHMRDDGIVRWSSRRTEDAVAIVIEDEGPGIPPAEMRLVTDRFFRGRHKSPSGSGLGLAIVKLALDAVGASLTLSNRKDRSGLRAEVFFPTTHQGTMDLGENKTMGALHLAQA